MQENGTYHHYRVKHLSEPFLSEIERLHWKEIQEIFVDMLRYSILKLDKDFPCKISQVYIVPYIPSICAIEGMSAGYYKFQISANVFK